MDEKLIYAIIGFCGTLIGVVIWIVKHQFNENARAQEKIEDLAERSIKAIENNNTLTSNNTTAVNELRRIFDK